VVSVILHIDFETRSAVDLTKAGVYRYAEDPSTDILCMAYAFDDDEPELWVPGDEVPISIVHHVKALGNLKAHNASFERIIWRDVLGPRYGFPIPDMEQWYCSAAEAAAMGLPRHLGQLASVLKLDQQKDDSGHRLMLLLSKPRKPRKDEDPAGLYWYDDPERLKRLYKYCRQDVRVEQAVSKYLRPLSAAEREVYLADQRLNDRGIMVDLPLVEAAERLAEAAKKAANAELEQLTGIEAVTAVGQLTEYTGLPDFRRDTLEKALKSGELDGTTQRVVELRLDTAKTSVQKLPAMRTAACSDGRVRGTLLFHGAGTGRWSGRIVQFQNVPRGEVQDPERLIPLVLAGDLDAVSEIAPPMVAISSLLRSMVRAAPGHKLIAGDYAQIEARVLAWLAGQRDLLDLFANDGPVYETMGAAIHGVSLEAVTKDMRQDGKTAVLGCGYGLGAKKFASVNDVSLEFAERVVGTYRERNRKIVQLWYNLERDIYRAAANPGSVVSDATGGRVKYTVRGQYLWCQLPSKRFIAYPLPIIEERETPWGDVKPCVTVCNVNSMTRKWERRQLYGGLATENVVQAIARDLLADAWLRAERKGYSPVMSVHDELVVEVPEDFGSADEFAAIMAETPAWADGLPVKVEAWEGLRYKK